jgi:hypothetical protein
MTRATKRKPLPHDRRRAQPNRDPSRTEQPTERKPPSDVLWGVPAIADFIERPLRQTYYMIERQMIPVKKLSHRIIVGSKKEIAKALSGADA